jgi:thioredoxin:protein disulfide reductase
MRGSRRSAVLVALAILLVPGLALASGGGDFESAQQGGWLWMYAVAFGAGLVTSTTPCVYPMIPITLAIFGARGGNVSKLRALALASAYVGGMGVAYATLGLTVALTIGPTAFGSQLSKPWIVIPLVVLFLALAASLFGAFELNLPSGLQTRLNQIGGKGFGGAFAMGLVGGFIAAPCTGPFLLGLLTFIAANANAVGVVGGGSLLFTYAIGMGVLFWVLAGFASSLPKSGPWMENVKSGAGVLLCFVALYYLKPLIPSLRTFASPEYWFLGAAFAIAVVGIALGAIHKSFHGSPAEKLRKGLGIALLLAGIFGIWTWKLTPKQHLPWQTVEATAFESARQQGKGVMVDFSATWCGPCEELELTFGDDEVYTAITDRYVPLKIDVTNNSDEDMEKRQRYGAGTLPSVVFLDTDGNVLSRVTTMLEPDEMLEVVREANRARGQGTRAQK